jgi:hypothetical protein
MTMKIAKALSVLLLSALLLAACGAKKPPTYSGGGYSSPTTTTASTNPSSSISSQNSATWVATQFAEINWSSNPKWSSPNCVYTLERPYLTPSMNASNDSQAARPAPASVTAKRDEDVHYGIGTYADVTQSWIATDAGVTATTCVVEVDLSIGTTQNGVESPAEGSTYEYAFNMEKFAGRWLVASPPQEPQ